MRARHQTRTIGLLTGALALLLPLCAVPAAGASAVPSVAEGTGPLIAYTGTFTQSHPEFPQTQVEQAHLVSATVTQDIVASQLQATVTLKTTPVAQYPIDILVALGRFDGAGACKLENGKFERVNTVNPADGATRTDTVITMARPLPAPAAVPWDCALAFTVAEGGTVVFDVMSGPLTPVYGPPPTPELSVGRAKVLRKDVSRLRLVRGVWTTLDVPVTNAATAGAKAEALRVTGSGRGLKVRPSPVLPYALSPGSTSSFLVQVKLVAKKKAGPLTLVATSEGAIGQRALPVRSVKAVKRPVSGKYRAQGKSKVSFRIKGRRLQKFKTGRLRTRCGGTYEPYTYTSSAYNFPTTRIGRDGLVNAVKRTDKYVINLQMKVVGKKVTQGYFSYNGPARCFASVEFTAKRR